MLRLGLWGPVRRGLAHARADERVGVRERARARARLVRVRLRVVVCLHHAPKRACMRACSTFAHVRVLRLQTCACASASFVSLVGLGASQRHVRRMPQKVAASWGALDQHLATITLDAVRY
eukprot:6176643-Pleurochrysis_carterae.AAC.1